MHTLLCFAILGSGGFGYYLQNDPPGKNDLIVHEFFALVNGNYNEDGDGEMNYEFDLDLSASWKTLATEFVECTDEKTKQSLKNVQDKAQNEEVVEKGVLTRNQELTRTMNRPDTVLKRQRLNRQDLNACLKAEDQTRKEDDEMWLKVRCASFIYHHLSSLLITCLFVYQ